MKKDRKRCTAVLLAAGNGSRMRQSGNGKQEENLPKQFRLLVGKPVIWYSLEALEQSEIIDDCVLVTGEEYLSYVREEILARFGFSKVRAVVAGGRERYESVYRGLQAAGQEQDFFFIHDGARPFLTEKILRDTYDAACRYGAAVAAVPAKDTVKIADEEGFCVTTPRRSLVWTVQTPQVFEAGLIRRAYDMLADRLEELAAEGVAVTDDAMVAETMLGTRVKLVEASYENIKLTTPEDMKIAESFLKG